MKQNEFKALSFKGSAGTQRVTQLKVTQQQSNRAKELLFNSIIFKIVILILLMQSFVSINKLYAGEPPPNLCVDCQTNSWFTFSIPMGYICDDSTICNINVIVKMTIGCQPCQLWIESIEEDVNCSCFGSLSYNQIFKFIVQAVLQYYQTSPGFCQGGPNGGVVHIFTSTCWKTTSPYDSGIEPNGLPNIVQAILPCGEDCCKNTYDLSTNPPTRIFSSAGGNVNCILQSGPRQNDVCYKVPCEDFIPFNNPKEQKITLNR